MENKVKSLKVIACILLILSFIFFGCGFEKKINYDNGEYSDESVNAYVGGDAYNIIINGEYFVGYVTFGSAAFISSVMLYCTSLLITTKETSKVIIEPIEEDLPKL